MEFDRSYFLQAYGRSYFVRNPKRKVRFYLDAIRALKPEGTLLEIGCAFGAFLAEAVGAYECWGVDVDAEVVAEAAQRVPRARVRTGALPDLEDERQYDIVACFDVLEHIEDLAASLAWIRTHLKPSGVLACAVPVYDGLLGRLVDRVDQDTTHVHRRSRAFWLETLTGAGFELRRVIGVFRCPLAGRWYIHWAHPALARHAAALFVLLQRTGDKEHHDHDCPAGL